MSEVTVSVKSRVPEFGRALDAAIERAVKAAVANGEAVAKMHAPVDTGFLRNSITGEMISDDEGRVSASAEYAVHVEYGTARASAQPFMTPAREDTAQFLRSRLLSELRGLL